MIMPLNCLTSISIGYVTIDLRLLWDQNVKPKTWWGWNSRILFSWTTLRLNKWGRRRMIPTPISIPVGITMHHPSVIFPSPTMTLCFLISCMLRHSDSNTFTPYPWNIHAYTIVTSISLGPMHLMWSTIRFLKQSKCACSMWEDVFHTISKTHPNYLFGWFASSTQHSNATPQTQTSFPPMLWGDSPYTVYWGTLISLTNVPCLTLN